MKLTKQVTGQHAPRSLGDLYSGRYKCSTPPARKQTDNRMAAGAAALAQFLKIK